MRLTRLQLSGFKSFADTVDLSVEPGVTAIVGPNGCGKSNISDSVRWVLGEQRARILRGARMEEIIFQGSLKRRPVSLAEVSLLFDNSDGALPIAFHEVAITRRLSRGGQGEYLINQSPVRLRDVQDLLRGTGLGSDAGAVIEAQMIERLLSDRAEERRSLFEEAAGIGLYRDRKSGTERRLEQTGEDLQRLEDVIREVQTQVRSLARQRGRAERHRKLRDERFAIVSTLIRRELADFDSRDAAMRSQRADLAVRVPDLEHLLEELERAREAAVQTRATAEARRTEVERRLAETRIDIGRLEGDLNVAGERLANAATRKQRAQDTIAEITSRATQVQREAEAARAERLAAVAALESVQTELDLRTASEDQARSKLLSERDVTRELEEGVLHLAENARALAGERSAIERDLEDLRTQAAEADQRRTTVAREWATARDRRYAANADLDNRTREAREAEAELERARHSLAAAREHEAAVRIERRAADEALAQLAARRGVLENLERERVGLAPAARRLLEARESLSSEILGPLSDYLHTSQENARLVERILGDWLHAVLVRDTGTVETVRQWHESNESDPLVLLPVSPAPAGSASGRARAARLGLTAKEPAQGWLETLLADDEPLDQTGSAIRRANGAVVLAGRDGGGGPLRRRAELGALLAELSQAEGQVEALQQTAEAAAANQALAEAALAAATARVERAHTAQRESAGAADDATRLIQRVERERNEADDAYRRAAERLQEQSDRLRQIIEALESGTVERSRLENEMSARRAALAEFEAAQEAARERRVHWQVEEAQVSARETAARERELRAEQALADGRQEIGRLEIEIATIDRDGAETLAQQSQWKDALAERRVAAQQLDAAATEADLAVTAAGRSLADGEATLARRRTERQELSELAHRLDLEESEAMGRRRVLVERFEAEWQRPLDTVAETSAEAEPDSAALREEAERLAREIEAIGPVNPLAVEEHAEEQKRLDFLTTQRDDLVKAREALQQAVREIDQTAQGLFTETFDAIRSNFQSVFQTLFEGGECDVRLADPSDPLASDIEIHAAPRGKRTQRIHLLSSGERALVAISLLFSIYLTKPSPFCLLDEVDAPLDDANVTRFVRLLDEFKADTQFIVITHNPRTMQVADAVYGVTMQEPGVSTIVGVRLGQVEPV